MRHLVIKVDDIQNIDFPAQVEDGENFRFAAQWLATFGLKSPTSLECQAALEEICGKYNLMGSKASVGKIEAGSYKTFRIEI